ncbi:MAG: hypothetical protein M5U01_16530 [Ardenticatenaceae bacterium]|nr:hypothetical protein [Ardenticatenaceae bacterium]
MLSLNVRTACAIVLIAASMFDLASNLMFTGRSVLKWFGESQIFLQWERGLLMAAFVLAAMGVSLLETLLGRAGGTVLPLTGATAFLVGAVVALVVEASFLSSGAHSTTPLEVTMVVVLFVAEALLGAAIIATSLLPAWVGWTIVAWDIAFLVVVTALSPGDIYYPALHFLPLTFIGVALLVMR